MPSGFHTWSQTSGTNASADSAINWAEGQAPSSVNDSARAEMAVLAKWRDDNNGFLTTGGTSTAFTLTTNTGFTTLALMDKQTLAFTMNATSGVTPTLNVDGLGAKVIRNATGVALPTGALLSGSVYHATYNNSSGEWLLHDQQPIILATGSVATAAIADAAVTLAKMENRAANKLIGRYTASTGVPQEVTVSTGLNLDASTGNLTAAYPPQGAFKNLSIKVATNTTVTVAADFVTTTDGTTYQTTALSGTVNLGTNGAANALDAGTIAVNTFYSIWAIAKADGTTAGLASTSATAPTLPTGYTFKARIGWVRTINATATLYGTWQFGRRAQYVVGLAQTTAMPIMVSAGTSGSTTVPTWTSVATGNFVPSTASEIAIVAANNTTGTAVMCAPNNSYGAQSSTSNPPPILIGGTGIASSMMGSVILESTNIYWASSSTTGILLCSGWTDNL